MAKVTSKLQITIPKASADAIGIRPGDEVEWIDGGGSLRLVRASRAEQLGLQTRLASFDAATKRIKARSKRTDAKHRRAWTRNELYERDR
jgi:AbrB family looped-hinge helix DNA binding protein